MKISLSFFLHIDALYLLKHKSPLYSEPYSPLPPKWSSRVWCLNIYFLFILIDLCHIHQLDEVTMLNSNIAILPPRNHRFPRWGSRAMSKQTHLTEAAPPTSPPTALVQARWVGEGTGKWQERPSNVQRVPAWSDKGWRDTENKEQGTWVKTPGAKIWQPQLGREAKIRRRTAWGRKLGWLRCELGETTETWRALGLCQKNQKSLANGGSSKEAKEARVTSMQLIPVCCHGPLLAVMGLWLLHARWDPGLSTGQLTAL